MSVVTILQVLLSPVLMNCTGTKAAGGDMTKSRPGTSCTKVPTILMVKLSTGIPISNNLQIFVYTINKTTSSKLNSFHHFGHNLLWADILNYKMTGQDCTPTAKAHLKQLDYLP
jgi:hypothetical protein